jgi:phage terminase large subunit GpA-like protein
LAKKSEVDKSIIVSEMGRNQVSYFFKKVKARIVSGIIPPFIEWAETFRYLPHNSSAFAGKFLRSSAPHLVEPLEMLHPDNPKTHVSIMKSVQGMVTTSVMENALGAWIYYQLGDCAMFTATQKLAEKRSKTTIATMIKRAGLVYEAIAGTSKGETTLHKQFRGNVNFYLAGYLSIGDMKSTPMNFIAKDELDEMPPEIKGQGDTNEIIEGRTLGQSMFKILNVSTPSELATSRIAKEYEMGDQRIYHVPCPLCGKEQELELKGEGREYGLTFDRKKNILGKKILDKKTVRYICKHCGESFKESKKQWMLSNGRWIPTATPKDEGRVSYHVSGLMSPEFALPWRRICQQWINCDFGQDILKFKDFTINYLGKPWAATQKAESWEDLRDRSEDYACNGDIPTGTMRMFGEYKMPHAPLRLYAGCDVQGNRLELQVVGFSPDKNKWARIAYQIFYGSPENIDDPCWNNLNDYVYNHSFKILGVDMYIEKCGLDCGYDPKKGKLRDKDFVGKSSVVYDFIYPRQDKFTAIMGISSENETAFSKMVKINDANSFLKDRLNIYVSNYKHSIMNIIKQSDGTSTIHMPRNIQIEDGRIVLMLDEIYKRFLSERYQEDPKKPGTGKMIFHKIHQRNEDFDTFIYAWAMADLDGVPNWSYEAWNIYYEGLLG